MNIYKLFKLATNGKTPRFVKLFGLFILHTTRRRYIGIFFDPVMGCNLRCRMCYFSNEEKRKEMKGIVSEQRLDAIEKVLLPHALKMQIGCGAEPTLYVNLEAIVKRARRAKVPYISLVTNGQRLADGTIDLHRLVEAGLNEITLLMHGTRRETYEYLMPGAKYENLLRLTALLAEVKAGHPDFKIRVNFTVNSMNLHDLSGENFWQVWPENIRPDIVQLRPAQDIGGSDWSDYDTLPIKEKFHETIGNVAEYCHRNGILCIAPTAEQIDQVATEQDELSAFIEDVTYYYVSPHSAYRDDFDIESESFAQYHKRHHTSRRLFAAIFSRHKYGRKRKTSKKLNYSVK